MTVQMAMNDMDMTKNMTVNAISFKNEIHSSNIAYFTLLLFLDFVFSIF